MSTTTFLNELDADDAAVRTRHREVESPQRLRNTTFEKRKRPSGYNGLHRRRNKRFAW